MGTSPQDARQSFGAMTACANCGAPFTPVVSGQTLCDRCQGLAHPEPVSPLAAAEVAGFKLVRELGAGRFALTWLAEDHQAQPVVLKLLRRYAPDPNSVQRFLAEAQRLAGLHDLDHPNLARPISAGVHLVSAFFLVYQSGGEQTLADELRQRGRVQPARALEFCAQVCEGLAVAHSAGILHLDLKPANVGISKASDGREQAVVLDLVTSYLLTYAQVPDAGPPLPLSSAAYRSPEEVKGLPPDARSDLYSVGVLLFQLLSGRLPMTGATAAELLEAHRNQPPLRLRDVGRKVHPDLEGLIAMLLAKDPAQRPDSGDEAAVLMRAIIPVADAAPVEDGVEAVEDPVPVVEAPRPEIAPAPPVMLPPAVDPALERAMMGHVPPQPPEKPPGIPPWVVGAPARWRLRAAGVAGVLAITAVAMLLARKPAPAGKAAVSETSPTAAASKGKPATKPVLPALVSEAVRREAAQDSTTPGGPEAPPPAPVPEPVQRKVAHAPSPYATSFDRAQKALWTDRTAEAESILRDLLRKPLSRRDRSRASKMMGDAETRKGRKASATAWYKKSLKLADDPDDRARLEKLLR